LDHSTLAIGAELAGNHLGVELVGFAPAAREHLLEGRAERPARQPIDAVIAETQPDHGSAAGRDPQRVVGGRLGADAGGIDRLVAAVDDEVVDAVLGVTDGGRAEDARGIGLVVGEQQRLGALAVEPARAITRFLESNGVEPVGAQLRLGRVGVPRPGVAKPYRGQQAQCRILGSAIGHRDPDQQVVGIGLGVLDLDVEIAGLGEDAGVDQLVLGCAATATSVLLDQLAIGIGRLRILVERPHVGVRRRAVEMEVVLLDVLAVIALVAGEPEQPLFQDRVASVPQRQREADALVAIADAEQAVLVPPVGA
jgi:hypothetical protein